jgi:competence protein ComEC
VSSRSASVVGPACGVPKLCSHRAPKPVLLVSLLLALALVPAGSASQATASASPGKIIFVNVEQGDAVVMKLGSTVVVSDVGEHRVENVDQALRSVNAKRIDVAILSHPHQDHVKNLLKLVRTFGWQIKLAVVSKSAYWLNRGTNKDVRDLLSDNHVPVEIANRGERFHWGGGEWLILNPPHSEFIGGESQAANASIAYLLTFNGVEALFTGDVEPKVARRIAEQLKPALVEPVDIFLATHHGSAAGSVQELLDVAKPRWAVLSTGPNTHGHPRPEAIQRLKQIGATIWCTDTNGSITARVSTTGGLTWRASRQNAPWWSGRDTRRNGRCVGR